MHSVGVVRGILATGGPSGRGTEGGGERMVCIIDYFYHQCYTKILYTPQFSRIRELYSIHVFRQTLFHAQSIP